LDVFFLFLESLLTYGNLKDDTHILVYTSTSFKAAIKENPLFNDTIIHFEINDGIAGANVSQTDDKGCGRHSQPNSKTQTGGFPTDDTIGKACKSRFDVFQWDSIKKYDKILYLDIDIIVKGDIHKVFDLCKEDILYVLEEGTVHEIAGVFDKEEEEEEEMKWGEINNHEDKSAFSTGIMLFKNCKIMRFLFVKVKDDMKENPHRFSNHELPHIVYNAFKYNLFDNKALKPFAVNNDFNICSDKIIHHFPSTTGIFPHKRHIMSYFLNNLNEYTSLVKEGEGGLFDFVEDCVIPVIDVCFWL
jgi:hypothetical protein